MPVNRDLFIARVTTTSCPPWTCSRCGIGTVTQNSDSFRSFETNLSQSLHCHDAWEPDWIEYRFTCSGTCSNIKCGEGNVIAGGGDEIISLIEDPTTGQYEQSYQAAYTTRYIYPAVSLFPLHDDFPAEVRVELTRAFELYWTDPNASANALRQSIERALDSIGIKKTQLKGKHNKPRKRHYLSLHNRIQLISTKHKGVGVKLLAAKWIANAGSHTATLTQHDLLDAFDLTEYALVNLFDTTTPRLDRLARTINRTKKPRSG